MEYLPLNFRMTIITWICIGVNVAVALFLVAMLFNPNQDVAGKSMLGLPIVALLACAGLAWLLLNRQYPVAALLISLIPAAISVYTLFLTLRRT